MKYYIKESILDDRTFKDYYFIFEQSKAKHEALKQYAMYKGFYWFEGLTGKGWHRGGSFYKPIINPSATISNNIQGFTDGDKVYILKRIQTNKPKKINELFS